MDTRVIQMFRPQKIPEKAEERSPHTLRHYFVITVMRATRNMRVAQMLARHSNISTTEIYADLENAELDPDHYEVFDG